MSELKAITAYEANWKAESYGDNGVLVYLKSAADKVIEELEDKLKVQTSIAEEGWKDAGTYHTSYAEAVKELYDKNKELRHHKYKRCFKMARWCVQMMVFNSKYGTDKKWHLFKKWRDRWLELAEKFKEGK